MLEKLLAEIRKNSTTSPAVLAQKLTTSVGMVKAMLDTLEEQGYLQTIAQECNPEKPCDSCMLTNLCSAKNGEKPRIRVFQENLKIT